MAHPRPDRPERPWPDPSTPFLSQLRAHSALRHELDAIIEELEPSLDQGRAQHPDAIFELLVLPNRVIARLDDVAVSFSWVNGRLQTVADGCLLIIVWSNLARKTRGVAALASARPMHEGSYFAEGRSSDAWRWRSDDQSADRAADFTAEPCSTSSLTAAWLARAAAISIADSTIAKDPPTP